MNKTLPSALLLLAGFGVSSIAASATADVYALPAGIQQGNILHCFNWTPSEVKAELKAIAEAGYGSVQLSPLQRPDARTGSAWHELYRPFDISFQESEFCSEQDLRDLCAEAATYGIKVIVDVVANHIDPNDGYHDEWWDLDGRIRWNGGIDYDDRFSITHGQLGEYGDVNSEDAQVASRAKKYVEYLKSLGVSGIRWDSAKHIGLPSEDCDFWSAVASVYGMWHYGVILDSPGDEELIREYVKFMSVTDNRYCDDAAAKNGGIPTVSACKWVTEQDCPESKMVYWGESHESYCNAGGWSKYHDQSTIDRAYAAFASRNGATALYLARPDYQDYNLIKLGKGRGTAWKAGHIAEINKFRNVMTGRPDRFENSGDVCTITRKDGGAVIVTKNEGWFTAVNGGGYCPEGVYTDRVGGHQITVTPTEIYGQTGEDCIAVIYPDELSPAPDTKPDPDPTPDPDPKPDPEPKPDPKPDPEPEPGTYIYFKNIDEDGDVWGNSLYVWAWTSTSNCTEAGVWPGDRMTKVEGQENLYRWDLPEGKPVPSQLAISKEGGYKAGGADLQFLNQRTYFPDGHAQTIIYGNPDPTPDPDPEPGPDPKPVDMPENLYVLGNIAGAVWDTTAGEEMVVMSPGVMITRRKVTFVASPDNYSYFNLSDALGSDWNDVNSKANRFGPQSKDEPLQLNGESKMRKFANEIDASACNSWKIAPGDYYVKADFNNGTVSLAETTAVNLLEVRFPTETIWYTMQGQRVESPASGIYIRVVDGRASKVLIP